MTYTTPELLLVGSANSLVLNPITQVSFDPACDEPDNLVLETSDTIPLW